MNTEPIRPTPRPDGRHYANINGITSGSIGCYFDSAGVLIAHTLTQGPKYAQLLAKLEQEIERRGVVIEQGGAQ